MFDKLTRRALHPLWAGWLERNRALWTLPETEKRIPEPMHQSVEADPSNPSPASQVREQVQNKPTEGAAVEKEQIKHSHVDIPFGVCARPGCNTHSNRCNLGYCVGCCDKYHEHLDPRNAAKGVVGFRVVDRTKRLDTTPSYVGTRSTPATHDKEEPPKPPVLGKVVKLAEPDWANTEVSPSYLKPDEKTLITNPDFKNLIM